MDLDCKRVIENLSLHSNPDLSHQERAEFKKHLVECQACQKEYEEMLHTVAVLESLPALDPPPDLVARTQAQITQENRRLRLAFFASPLARILNLLKLGPHPTLVNCTAMIFYLMLTVFLVKLTFFDATEPTSVDTPNKSLRPHAQIVGVPLGSIKATVQRIGTEEEESKEVSTKLE
jgi:anti-sigma factor RsiW